LREAYGTFNSLNRLHRANADVGPAVLGVGKEEKVHTELMTLKCRTSSHCEDSTITVLTGDNTNNP